MSRKRKIVIATFLEAEKLGWPERDIPAPRAEKFWSKAKDAHYEQSRLVFHTTPTVAKQMLAELRGLRSHPEFRGLRRRHLR